jgi:hypothetical protein
VNVGKGLDVRGRFLLMAAIWTGPGYFHVVFATQNIFYSPITIAPISVTAAIARHIIIAVPQSGTVMITRIPAKNSFIPSPKKHPLLLSNPATCG